MNSNKQIPILIGVSGHIDLNEADVKLLEQSVKNELSKIVNDYPDSPVALLTSLAAGADLLCADSAKSLGIPLIAALPMEASEFTSSFSYTDKKRFESHLSDAAEAFVVPATEEVPDDPSDDFWYRQAGIYISEHSHILMALWDGQRSQNTNSCGTSAAVGFSLNAEYKPAKALPLRNKDNTCVIHIFTPRAGIKGNCGEVKYLGNTDAVQRLLNETNAFNKECNAGTSDRSAYALLPAHEKDIVLDRLEAVYHAADCLSLKNAAIYKKLLATLAVTSTIITVAFLLYDELSLYWMLIVCGIMLVAAWVTRRNAEKLDCHKRYIEYRALAESLRVSAFLRYAGSRLDASGLFTWTQKEDLSWIMTSVLALTAGPSPKEQRTIKECWVDAQKEYHEKAAEKTRAVQAGNDRVVGAALILSILLYIAALVFEIFCGGMLSSPVVQTLDTELVRVIIKVAMGSISAATLFMANYFGKQSLSRKAADHAKMSRFYSEMGDMITRFGQSDEILAYIAKEELIENGNWSSYQQDNSIEFNL